MLRPICLGLAALLVMTGYARAQTLTQLFGFNGANGRDPKGALVLDGQGNLFGTTFSDSGPGTGNVFRLSPDGAGGYTHSIIVDFFTASNFINAQSYSGLTLGPGGVMFGTASYGGPGGTVFRISPNGAGGFIYTPRLSGATGFGSGGVEPWGGVVIASTGTLFGTTKFGGTGDVGTVYQMVPNGSGGYSASTIFRFGALQGLGGMYPEGTPLIDAFGNLYGTTNSGGPGGRGTVFRLSPDGAGGYSHSVLMGFSGLNGDTATPTLAMDMIGDIFGTTYAGGTSGRGTVFRLSPDGNGNYTHSVLMNFTSATGERPLDGVLIDAAGNLFGTTRQGGANGVGVAFRMTPTGGGQYSYTKLVDFTQATGQPEAALIADGAGNLYGTGVFGDGSVFRISNAGFVVAQQVDAPEPGTLALFGLGLAGLAAARSRQGQSGG